MLIVTSHGGLVRPLVNFLLKLKVAFWQTAVRIPVEMAYFIFYFIYFNFVMTRPPMELLPLLGHDVMPTLDVALLCSSRAVSDLGHESKLV